MSGKRQIRIVAVRKKEPNVRLYVLALIELARQMQAEEEAPLKKAAGTNADQEDGQ